MINAWFHDDDFQYGFEAALGTAFRQAADVGEVLATAARIIDGDADSWLHEWTSTAGAVWSAAVTAERRGLRVSALASYRRAATYYSAALYRIEHSSEPDRRHDVWRRQRDCWERVVDLTAVPGERIAIGYEGTTLPGYFFRAPDAQPGERRPLVVVNNGSDGATSQTWALAGAAASERAYHWMTFDGPGQQAAWYDQHIPFRPDWENVLTPVLNAMLARPDVEPSQVVVVGIGQGGYWVPRALAFEHRFAAAVVDPGVVDVATILRVPLSAGMRSCLEGNERDVFDREMHLAELFSPVLAATLRLRGDPYGPTGGSRYDLYRRVAGYRLNHEAAQIRTPMLVTDPEGEQFWPGQSRQLYDALPGTKELVRFSAAEGAGRHGEPLGAALRETRIFDWLEQYLHPREPSTTDDHDRQPVPVGWAAKTDRTLEETGWPR